MATNMAYKEGRRLKLTVPEGTVSGDPVCVGELCGVALIDRQSDGTATVDLGGVYSLSVAAIDNSGAEGADANKAVSVGDKIYYASGDDPVLSKRADGTYFGIAYGAITAGETATIAVKIRTC